MKKVVALTGTTSIGKSTTIRKAYELLIVKYPSARIAPAAGRWGIDVKVIITIDGVKIGIEGRGDPGSALPQSLDEFVRIGCSIIICARRTRERTFNAVEQLAEKGYEIVSIPQVVVSELSKRSFSNQKTADQIVREVEKSLNVVKSRAATP